MWKKQAAGFPNKDIQRHGRQYYDNEA